MTTTTSARLERRQTHFDFEHEPLPVDWFRGALFPSVGLTALTYLFPLFEDVVIAEMRRSEPLYVDRLGPDLVRDFIGHESRHSRAHEASFVAIRDMGYHVESLERAASAVRSVVRRALMPFIRSVTPRQFPLGMCAAGEHWTSELSLVALEHASRLSLRQEPGAARRSLVFNDMELLFMWHALEEIEHRSVCFDAFLAAGGTLRQRRAAFLLNTTLMTVLGLPFAAALIRQSSSLLDEEDGRRRSGWRARLRRNLPVIIEVVRSSAASYWRDDFHPGSTDRDAQCALLRGLLPRDKVTGPPRPGRRRRERMPHEA